MTNNLLPALQIYFIRNGETEGNKLCQLQGQTEGKLSLKGIEQAKRTGIELKKLGNITHIYSSPLARAYDTFIHCNLPNYPTTKTNILRERTFGSITNKTYFDMIHLPPDEKPGKDGESLVDLRHRSQEFLSSLVEQYTVGDTILVFSHHEFILSCVMGAIGIPLENTRNMMISNASITQLDFYNNHWVAKRINDLGHLGELKQTNRAY